jgi:mono/diheme cytochrome c family protein
MNRAAKWALGIAGAVLVLATSGVGYLLAAFPKVGPATGVKVEPSPALAQRGEYLARHVTVCVDCHSERDFGRFSGPPRPGTEGKGGDRFGHEHGFPGELYSKNITPFALGGWSDGELIRAVTAGVAKDGTPLFPMMPYLEYGTLCERDVHAIVTFVRSLKPIESSFPARKLDFPMSLIVRTIPKPPSPSACPDPGDRLANGKYLATVAGCAACHTPQDKGQRLPGMDFAGGFPFGPFPNGGGTVNSSNITPDTQTGIGGWTREAFIARFKAFEKTEAASAVAPGGFNTAMPWTMYAGMTVDDLGSIYDYLRTLKPVRNKVERWIPP